MTVLIFLGLGVSFVKDGSAMFSPGKLTAYNSTGLPLNGFESHAEFEKDCQYCHHPLQTTQADLCVRCHTTIMKQVADGSGTHAKIGNISACRACHSDHQGPDFDPSAAAFDLFDHAMTDFTLTWHQLDYDLFPITCEDCHTRAGDFQIKTAACQDCHGEYDPDFISQHVQSLGDRCITCHDGSGTIANFDHTITRFPLEGKHLQVQCVDCHTGGQFSQLPGECWACHAEPEIHTGLFTDACQSCHTPVDWSALIGLNGQLFDHFEQSQFGLKRHMTDYAGQPIRCADCHTSPDGFKVAFDLRFCVNCHTTEDSAFMDQHRIQFGVDCLTCHDGLDRMHDFDHDRFFILDGAHAGVDCSTCHVEQVFSSTSSECQACHSEPEIHAGVFGLQCESCHSTEAWSPARMVHHTFPLDHGEQGLLTCETCHVERYTEYTCYGCHEHQPGEIQSEHLEEGISQAEMADCFVCHPDGREHDD